MRDRLEFVKKQNFRKRERALSERVRNNTRTFVVSLSSSLLLINIANGIARTFYTINGRTFRPSSAHAAETTLRTYNTSISTVFAGF